MESQQKTADKVADLSYEECYGRLQTVLEKLEAADLPLADSLDLYETGMVLAARCGDLLEEAELRVRQWQPDGTVTELSGAQDQ